MHHSSKFAVLIVLTLANVVLTNVVLADPPRFASDGVLLPGSQFMYDSGFDVFDWDDDGRADLVLANNAFTRFGIYHPSGDPENPQLGHSFSYPYNLTETMPQTIEHGQGYAWCDLNSDGLRDLLVYDGQLRMLYNTGTKTERNHWHMAPLKQFFPASDQMIKENRRYVTGPESMYWKRGIFPRHVLSLTVTDWDADGLDDLIICRFRDEAPGVVSLQGYESWTIAGCISTYYNPNREVPPKTPEFLLPLKAAPARETWFYKNTGTPAEPYFDAGVEIKTSSGEAVVAPNLQAVDLDGDGVLDLLASETKQSCNNYRVDWPTATSVQWFRRPDAQNPALLEPAEALLDAQGKAIPAGIMARVADFRGNDQQDLFVQDANGAGTIRWYKNSAPAGKPLALAPVKILRGEDFCRFNIMHSMVVDWFGPGSRDLILHGGTEAHCKWSRRRTALYRNIAKKPGEIAYSFVGYLNFNGDLAMVSPKLEDRPYDCYGTFVSLAPDLGDGKKRLVMSVSGKCYWFSDLAADGLTFQQCQSLDLPAERNRRHGWQEIPVDVAEPVQYIRLNNDRNGMHGWRDHYLNIRKFEAISGGKNVATLEAGATASRMEPPRESSYRIDRPEVMLSTEPTKEKLPFTSLGYASGPGIVKLKQPTKLEQIRFLLSETDNFWYSQHLPFFWQGELFRARTESADMYYQYTVEVSADNETWTKIADTLWVEMARSTPWLMDWNGDGKLDLLLCAMHTKGIYPQKRDFRLYLNQGDNDQPKFAEHQWLCDEAGKPLGSEVEWAQLYSPQTGMVVRDFDEDGKHDLLIEGIKDGSVEFWQNVSTDNASPRFKFIQKLGDPTPIKGRPDNRYFWIGDVDGDNVLDWLETRGETIGWFKGTAAHAPAEVNDLAIKHSDSTGITVSWTAPENAQRFEIGWSTQPITTATWMSIQHIAGQYPTDSSDSDSAEHHLTDLPPNTPIFVRVKSFNQAQEDSPLSNEARSVTAPSRQIVLRNGPAEGIDRPEYDGCQMTYLHSKSPKEPAARDGQTVQVTAPGTDGHRIVLIRFDELPKLSSVEKATLELTLPLEEKIYEPAYCEVSCIKFRPDWNPEQATYEVAATGVPWKPSDLGESERILSRAPREPIYARTPVHRWDVTEAVRTAKEKGSTTISLLLRVDFTGHYVAGRSYTFCDTTHPKTEFRPRLRVQTH